MTREYRGASMQGTLLLGSQFENENTSCMQLEDSNTSVSLPRKFSPQSMSYHGFPFLIEAYIFQSSSNLKTQTFMYLSFSRDKIYICLKEKNVSLWRKMLSLITSLIIKMQRSFPFQSKKMVPIRRRECFLLIFSLGNTG